MPDNAKVVQLFFDKLSMGDFDGACDLMTPGSVHHLPGLGSERCGTSQWRRLEDSVRDAFPDRAFRVHQIVSDGDRTAARVTWSATHKNTFANTPPTGKRVEVNGFDIFRISDGKIAEQWSEQDILGLHKQIGAAPGTSSSWPI